MFYPFQVGKPIEVPKVGEPDDETLEKYHNMYMEELSRLFDEHKTKYGVSEDKTLNFV